MKTNQLHQLFKECTGVSTDTRKIEKNTMFFALKGENFNGNKFAQTAINLGAKYAIVDEDLEINVSSSIIKVDNALNTLQELASFHRKTLKTPIIALTGSNGKTTTKELINAVLSTQYKTIATKGNLNNHIGVPLTLLEINESTHIAVVEMGANHQKEIEFLCEIAQPDFGLITNYGKAHLEGFGGVEGVIKGKTEMYIHLKSNHKTIFYNSEDAIQSEKIRGYSSTFKFSTKGNGDVNLQLVDTDPTLSIMFEDNLIKTNLTGTYNFTNVAYAILIGKYFKISDEKIKKAIEGYVPQNNRSQILKTNRNKIVLDAYNANPTSMALALESFEKIKHPNKIALLGDMFELGEAAQEEHQNIINLLETSPINRAVLIGKHFYSCNIQSNFILQFETFEDAFNYLKKSEINNAQILIKASRGMALERLVELF
ncbi:UDP-N-acetylmuramoyl-tripeptide--D-alanyl-D-alanine ligase [Paucihalobacter ruber]|uniref:UDP-N-acetylmuramoyl-tripeptide--D-alanyl-D-alanine ligase n=1 Tax=Paucihalobacter ruber TaxID=2567861 RepID=A0A506PM49_9FLAO|nr:UDP-N-acetylmuramoyl-tripeptide--D-alanyl-D-alanine ligase [Paucihalobacter ruber]TPV34227.1 UDP-N-acetylmuramoyl-tripeptide--D-alanyl-D-alanine ligase [Paucihalobacter ruber]